MAKKISRSRAIQSGVLQVLGGVLILAGVVGGGGLSAGWQGWLGLAVSFYFAATGGYRTYEALKLPRD